MSLLEVAGVSSGYGRLTVVHEVSLSIAPGEIVVLLGPNGAGKTTLLRTIAGNLTVSTGTITFDGEDVTPLDAYRRSRVGVGYVPQDSNVFRPLTVRENLAAATLFNPERSGIAEDVMQRFPRLRERTNQLASTLSGGERQMLAVGSAMVGDPRLILLDEPTAGLAPRFVREIVEWMREFAAGGRGVLWVVEQNPDAVLGAASRAYFMSAGEIRGEQEAQALASDPDLLRRVLFDG